MFGSRYWPLVGMTAKRTGPVNRVIAPFAISTRSSARLSTSFAALIKVSPKGVIITFLLLRSVTCMPRTCLRSRITKLKLDWVTWHASAANPKWRWILNAERYWSCFNVGKRRMKKAYYHDEMSIDFSKWYNENKALSKHALLDHYEKSSNYYVVL